MADLKQIIASLIGDNKNVYSNTLVPANHLSQMKLFGIRQGIEPIASQDDGYGSRQKFLANIWKQNKLDLFQDKIWDYTLCLGQCLLYLRPTKEGNYRIDFYKNTQFRTYENKLGDLTEVVIIYSYKVRNQLSGTEGNQRWVKLVIKADTIRVSESETKYSFDYNEFETTGKTYKNTLGFIPCVVIRNKPTGPGGDGEGEFDWLQSQIEEHDRMMASMNSNLLFFGSPSLVSTRSPQEIMETIETESSALTQNRVLSSAAGWYGSTTPSSYKQDPFVYRNNGGVRVKRVVGNVQPDERFGYISPDPITPDHAQHVREMREALHFALGGIDERGMNLNATAYEMKSIYGRVSATAMKKCRAIYDHGFCKLLEMAIAAEEDLFRQSLAFALKKDISEISDGLINELGQAGKLPPNLFGLPPMGSREINWRWRGPVFERSPKDLQMVSIVARNMQELGVRSLEALKLVFEDKTDKELEGMLEGGYPFRYMSSVASTTQQMIGLYQQMLGVPSQDDPNIPMGALIPIQPLVNRSIQTLYKELNYEPDNEPVRPGDPPTYNTGQSDFDAYTASIQSANVPGQLGNTTSTPAFGTAQSPNGAVPATSAGGAVSPTDNSGFPSPLSATGIKPFPVTGEGQPMGNSVQQGSLPPEFAAAIPTAGTTATLPTTSPVQSEQSVLGSSVSAGSPIPPDLAVGAGQPGSIWQQLFPNFTAAVKPINAERSRGKRSRKK